jgi:hypothetical protein
VLAFFGFAFLVIFWVSLKMFRERLAVHTYVSQWYMFGAAVWFPIRYSSAGSVTNHRAGGRRGMGDGELVVRA